MPEKRGYCLQAEANFVVTPDFARAGSGRGPTIHLRKSWIPAFAGMTL